MGELPPAANPLPPDSVVSPVEYPLGRADLCVGSVAIEHPRPSTVKEKGGFPYMAGQAAMADSPCGLDGLVDYWESFSEFGRGRRASAAASPTMAPSICRTIARALGVSASSSPRSTASNNARSILTTSARPARFTRTTIAAMGAAVM